MSLAHLERSRCVSALKVFTSTPCLVPILRVNVTPLFIPGIKKLGDDDSDELIVRPVENDERRD